MEIAGQAVEGAEEVRPKLEAGVARPLAEGAGAAAVHRPIVVTVTNTQVLIKTEVADAVAKLGHADRRTTIVVAVPPTIATPAQRRDEALVLRTRLPALLPQQRPQVPPAPLLPAL